LFGSFINSAHPAPHIVAGMKQTQLPRAHTLPLVHACPHEPQFNGLPFVLMHNPPHTIDGAAHVAVHIPALHT
jgi:hypothetical protein